MQASGGQGSVCQQLFKECVRQEGLGRAWGVLSWKMKLEKLKDLPPCFSSQDGHSPFNLCAAVKAILKSAYIVTHTHTSLRKNVKL